MQERVSGAGQVVGSRRQARGNKQLVEFDRKERGQDLQW